MQHGTLGYWKAGNLAPAFDADDVTAAIQRIREPLHVVADPTGHRRGVALSGSVLANDVSNGVPTLPVTAILPPLYPEWLGDRSFCEVHGTRFPYVAGAMANGIATPELVIAMAKAGMLGFFGAAGLAFHHVEAGIDRIAGALAGTGRPWGANLIHSPNEPALEARVAALYLERGVRRVSASAFMALTPAIVHYACKGLREQGGRIVRQTQVFCKISRSETATHFLSPAPDNILNALVADGRLTTDEARLARQVPVAEDVIVEADSGGHTDNRTLTALFPVILRLRDELQRRYGYSRPIRVGAAGGIGTPSAVAAAFGLGAAFVLTGSVNQAAVESGLSPAGRAMLAKAGMADVAMAPAADMFELGVEVQVLKRGTLFSARAKKLHEIYKANASLHSLSESERTFVETKCLRTSVATIQAETEAFWGRRDADELARARANPKHMMALVFRWYLGLASRWAITGEAGREVDYQIWCGPAMGAFNDWAKGSFLEQPENRQAVQIARNLLEGAAVITRAQQLRSYGVPVPPSAFRFMPRPLD